MNAAGAEGGPWRLPVVPALVLALLTVTLMALPEWVRLPMPDTGILIRQAVLEAPGAAEMAVALPHSFHPATAGPASITYEMRFTPDWPVAGPQELYVPAARHALDFTLNGRPGPAQSQSPWIEAEQGVTWLVRVPHHLLVPGENVLRVTLARSEGSIPFYLSPVQVGPVSDMGQSPWFAVLLAGQGRIAAFALHMVVLAGLVILWTARRHDPVFRWLALLGGTTLVATLPDPGGLPGLMPVPIQTLLLASFGIMTLGLALALAGKARPPWLAPAIIGVPLVLLALVLVLPGRPLLPALLGVGVALAGHVLAAAALIAAFLEKRRWDMGFLAVPLLLVAWIGLRDVLVVTGLREAPFLLSGYVRPLTMLAVVVLLMRRLAASLNSLDRANDELRLRLAEQQTQLQGLHERERQRAAQAVRDERQRLTRDLHDGLSGHLVSIIALSERGADHRSVEGAARAALEDLRLVINSLDIGEGDLPLALAGFRERIEPQLRRLGVALDWSMDKLPDISGVTPEHALSVLRILQEALTNALKHGATRTLRIHGGPGAAGALIRIDNDGVATGAAGQGHGLASMGRRAAGLGGEIAFTRADGSATLCLGLPLRLAGG